MNVSRLSFLPAIGAAALTACAGASPETPGSLLRPVGSFEGQVRFVGWLSHHGEFQLYDTRRSLVAERKAPHCVSGTAPTLTQEELANFDGQRVEIEGKLVDYESLPFESEYVLARKLLGGKVVPNWCFGEKVLLADSIRIR